MCFAHLRISSERLRRLSAALRACLAKQATPPGASAFVTPLTADKETLCSSMPAHSSEVKEADLSKDSTAHVFAADETSPEALSTLMAVSEVSPASDATAPKLRDN